MAKNIILFATIALCALRAHTQRAANHTSSDYVVLADQQDLIRSEQKLVSFLYNYTAALESAIGGINEYMSKYSVSLVEKFQVEGHSFGDMSDLAHGDTHAKQLELQMIQFAEFVDTVLSDFDWAYRGLVRMTEDLPGLDTLIDTNFEALKSVEAYFEDVKNEGHMRLPEVQDLEELRTWLGQMWLMYDWSVEDLQDGNMEGIMTKSGLDVEQIIDIASKMIEENLFSPAIKLLGLLDAKLKTEIMRPGTDITDAQLKFGVELEKRLEATISQHDLIHDKVPAEFIQINPFLYTEKVGRFDAQKHGKMPSRRRVEYHELPPMFRQGNDLMRTQGIAAEKAPYLCAAKSRPVPTNLKCFYKSDHHPFWVLAPQKTEVLNDDPLVVQVYDVLSESLLDDVKEYTHAKSFRGVVYTENGTLGHSHTRIASDYTLEPVTERWKKMSRLAEMTTGLGSMDERLVERIKVSTYPTGGHFAPHLDALFLKEVPRAELKGEQQTGDRTITFLYYMSNVELGGRTAFPLLDTFAEPVSGSIVYWYNLYPDCSTDYRSWHLSCPTVLGNKWVAVKLIRNYLEAHESGHCEADLDLVKNKATRHDVFTGKYRKSTANIPQYWGRD